MLRPSHEVTVYLYAEPVDMRKFIDGLTVLVEQELQLSPMQGALFVFCNRYRDKIKLLCWERNDFVLRYKRLEQQRFHWPKDRSARNLPNRARAKLAVKTMGSSCTQLNLV